MNLRQRITKRRLLSAAVIESPDHAAPLAQALLAGGLDVMEVTFRNVHAAECIRRIRAEVPEMAIGAGTLLTAEQIDAAIGAGAQFGVSPGFHPAVIHAANERDFFFIPGVATPGEMEQALALGCEWVKLFPAEAIGGVKYLESLAACYAHTPLRVIPLGGVSETNMADYLASPLVVAVGGSWLTNRQLAESGKWDEITALTKRALAISSNLDR